AEASGIPYSDFAMEFARSSGSENVWHSYGAIQCLERFLPLLREDGFILMNDYGHTDPQAGDHFEHQRMSRSTFIGINFPQLKAYFGEKRSAVSDQQSAGNWPLVWAEPAEDAGSIYARLLGHRPAERTLECFRSLFSK